jgi:hypothetical protein
MRSSAPKAKGKETCDVRNGMAIAQELRRQSWQSRERPCGILKSTIKGASGGRWDVHQQRGKKYVRGCRWKSGVGGCRVGRRGRGKGRGKRELQRLAQLPFPPGTTTTTASIKGLRIYNHESKVSKGCRAISNH